MPIHAAGSDDSTGVNVWQRYARRNAITLGVVAAIGIGAAVAVAGGSDNEHDADGGSRGTATLPGGSLPADVSSPPSSVPSSVPSSSTPSSTSSSTTSSTSTTTTTIDPADVAHAYPVDPAVNSSFTPQAHANYQATDIFASSGCGTSLLSPVTGEVAEVRPNVYDPAVDDPATRGGNAVSIRGDDGVRYYLAHFQAVDPAITPGARVVAGDYLGEMGDTGRSSACHVHFGLSLPCDNDVDDWWIRRGVIWPDEYLASWRDGGNLSPLPELQTWFEQNPGACDSIENTPYPIG